MSLNEKREKFLPLISRCFADNGFRGTTTAKIASACNVRENVLYRIWPSKKDMFLDCLEHVYELTISLWRELEPDKESELTHAELILQFQAADHGLSRYYRLVFAGLMENDQEIRKALRQLYRKFQSFLSETTDDHRRQRKISGDLNPDSTAWVLMGIAAMVDIQRELRILSNTGREKFLTDSGMRILNHFK